ncbi:LOW QUALITY PROTEIN: glucan endo-1,3-beta-glucosidase, basic vacuolar-like [Vigna angularis]|uniref:LOW QUALITY PROTEIN: glucan endo-1,3-beta-glucosidase, basic vacuolar-like n=1 Tax=Phaseolus angularis TaxID=3914 RepID=UPI0022B31EBD|nr:LOW QUALITY PROTEIN: glucan endo-1,3-beta-glucosidase, basic vacuolar-like [Vigna angularis]
MNKIVATEHVYEIEWCPHVQENKMFISSSTALSKSPPSQSSTPPSNAQFQEPPGITLFGMLLQFLQDTYSCFLINLYTYNLYHLNPEIPLSIALFQEYPFNFRDNFTIGVLCRNLFNVMVDVVVTAFAVAGYETIPLVVIETGWPSFSAVGNEFDANLGYAWIYLRGLVQHLKSGMGTSLLKDGVHEVFVYEMFDKEEGTGRSANFNFNLNEP